MVVMSTNFQHKKIHKIIWLSPDQNTASQIDHIIINANKQGVTRSKNYEMPQYRFRPFLSQSSN